MKILHISSVPVDYPGGTEKVIIELAKRQSRNNTVCILQTNLYLPDKKPGVEKFEGIKIITCKNDYWFGGFGFSKEFIKNLQMIWKDYDVVHIHGHGRFTSTYSLNFLNKKKPIVYSAQGFFHKKNIIKNIYDLLFGRLLKKADICTALTEIEVEHLIKNFDIKKSKIKILPGGLDLNKYKKPSESEISSFKKKYNLNKKNLLYVGRIHHSKGLQHVIHSIRNIDCKFLIVGKDSGYKQELVEEINRVGVSEKVVFAEGLDDDALIAAYYSSDAFVLFSEWEGFGIVIIEAMYSGIPVVVSNNGALPVLVKDAKNGYIAHNKEELRKKILLAFKKDKNIIKNALLFSKQFSWDNVNKKCEEIYHEVLTNEKQ